MSFKYPTTTGDIETIEGTAPAITALFSTDVQPFVVDPDVVYTTYFYNGVDAGLWYNGTAYLLLVANTETVAVFVPWEAVGLGGITNSTDQVQRLISIGQHYNDSGLNIYLSEGVGMYIAVPP